MTSNILIIFLLFFLPLLVVPFGYAWFEPPKVICAEVLIEILLAISLFRSKFHIPYSKFLFFPLLTLFLLTVIDLIFFRTQTTLWGNIFRLQGIFLLWNLIAFALISSQIKLSKIPSFVYLIPLFGLFISCFILGKNDIGRSYGTPGEPNALAASVIFLLPFCIFGKTGRFFKGFLVLIVLWIILMSGSRAGLVAFGIQIIFLLLAKWFTLKKTVLICLATLTLTLPLPLIEGGGWYENRAEVWQASLAAGFINPIIGGGFGNIEKLLPKGSEIAGNNARYQYVDSSHNFLLDYWVSGGLIGLIIILFLIYKTLKNFIFEKEKLELAIFLGLITVMLFNPVSVVTLVQFWFLIGQGFRQKVVGFV